MWVSGGIYASLALKRETHQTILQNTATECTVSTAKP